MGIIARAIENTGSTGLAEPAKWFKNLMGGAVAESGIRVDEQGALRLSTVFACVKVISETLAMLPLPVYRRMRPRGKERIDEHILFELLNIAPNPEMTAYTFKETIQAHILTWGNGYAEIEEGPNGQPKALWPLRPDRVRPERRQDGRIWYDLTLPGGAGNKWLPSRLIFHIPGLGFNGLMGYSPIAIMRDQVGLALAAERYGSRYFRQGTRPNLVLEHPTALDENDVKTIRQAVETAHGGLEKAFRLMVLEEGVTLKDIGLSHVDIEFIATRKFQIAEILRAYRMPPHKVQEMEDATYDNIEHQAIEFVSDCLMPHCERWKQNIALQLMTPTERRQIFCEVLINALLRGAIIDRFEAYRKALDAGWLNADEVRDMENLNPIPNRGGEDYYKPLNMIAVAGPNAASQQAAVSGNRSFQIEEKRKEIRVARSVALRERINGAYHRIFSESATRILRKEVADIRRAVKKYLGGTNPNADLFKEWLDTYYQEHRPKVVEAMSGTTLSFATETQAAVAEEIDAPIGMDPALEAFVAEYVRAFSYRHVDSSKGQLAKLIEQSPEAMAEAVEQRLQEWEERRPETIAGNEVIQGGNAIALAVYAAAGITVVRWYTRGPDPCPYCRALSNRGIGINANFVEEGEFNPDGADAPMQIFGPRKHPPLHGGCVCFLVSG